MELILSNVEPKHKKLFSEMARALNFTVKEIQNNEDAEMIRAIEEGKKLGRATPAEKAEFEKWLFKK